VRIRVNDVSMKVIEGWQLRNGAARQCNSPFGTIPKCSRVDKRHDRICHVIGARGAVCEGNPANAQYCEVKNPLITSSLRKRCHNVVVIQYGMWGFRSIPPIRLLAEDRFTSHGIVDFGRPGHVAGSPRCRLILFTLS
jgi:hypothetical protein